MLFSAHLLWFSIILLAGFASSSPLEQPKNVEKDKNNEYSLETTVLLRKCCPNNQYFSGISQECVDAQNDDIWKESVYTYLLNSRNISIQTVSQLIKSCPDTLKPPEITPITDFSHTVSEDGSVYHKNLNVSYNLFHYCLEMVGTTYEESFLVFAFCPSNNILPKCCPHGHYFDTRDLSCVQYYDQKQRKAGEVLLDYLPTKTKLLHKDFTCAHPPTEVSLSEASFQGKELRITKNAYSYSPSEFCIDNMIYEGVNEFVPSATICSQNFVLKCCPEGESLHEYGCSQSSRESLSLTHIKRNSRIRVQSLTPHVAPCTPITIEDDAESEIRWSLDPSVNHVKIYNRKHVILTENYCVDDFVNEEGVFFSLKICSEEIHEAVDISRYENMSEIDVIGKCCPANKIYERYSTKGSNGCVEVSENAIEVLESFLHLNESSHLTFTGAPDCSTSEVYHKFNLTPFSDDYAELTANGMLRVIRRENECIVHERKLPKTEYCIDLVERNNELIPMAIVCASGNSHNYSKDIIVVTLASISCAALISTFFFLVFMRVRRGMITVKKIDTLAGRILMSYVLSQLVGYLTLSIVHLSDYGEDPSSCFLLTGFLMFFMLAAFCWNTSICMEGLLLTMHVQVPEWRRYVYHSIWAWGVPGVLTATALIRDAKREELSCDSVTPKIGMDRCFFSDRMAQLLYLTLPITLTVILNSILLVLAKVLRRKKLKNLEKDPNRPRRHEPLHQVLSKNIKNKIRGEVTVKPVSNHSGLRTHQNKNIWVESLKLVMWSGTTWLMELIGTIVPMHINQSKGEWYHYMWLIPVGINCLRGLGIFVIITLTTENKTRLMRTVRWFETRVGTRMSFLMSTMTMKSKKGQTSKDLASKSTNRDKLKGILSQGIRSSEKEPNLNVTTDKRKARSTSVSTIVTNISNTTLDTPSTAGINSQAPLFYHSVSQQDGRVPSSEGFDSVDSGLDEVNFDIIEECPNDADDLSLDNTSMENVFWDPDIKVIRDEVKSGKKSLKVRIRTNSEEETSATSNHAEATEGENHVRSIRGEETKSSEA